MAKAPQRQPEILGRAELAALFAAANNLKSRALLMTIYAAGLRVSEACALPVADIDSQPDRLCLRVRQGKGARDRYTLLSPTLLQLLRLTGGLSARDPRDGQPAPLTARKLTSRFLTISEKDP